MTEQQLPEDPESIEDQLAGLHEKVGQLLAATRDLPEMRDRQRSYAALVQQFAELRDSVTKDITSVHLRLKKLARTLDDALGTGKVKPPQAPYLADLPDDEFAQEIGELRDWVNGFLRPNYQGYELRDCWINHLEALWELDTLRAEWRRVYSDPDNRALEDAIRFHDRLLPGVLARLATSIKCTPGGDCQARARRARRPAAG
jgi:hypothetical protein